MINYSDFLFLQDNNPDSAAYKRKLEELIDEDDALIEEPVAKSSRLVNIEKTCFSSWNFWVVKLV